MFPSRQYLANSTPAQGTVDNRRLHLRTGERFSVNSFSSQLSFKGLRPAKLYESPSTSGNVETLEANSFEFSTTWFATQVFRACDKYGIVFEASRMDSHYINKLRKGPERDREIGALGPHSDHRWSSLPRQLCQSLCFASAHFIGNVRGIPPAKDSPAFLPASKL